MFEIRNKSVNHFVKILLELTIIWRSFVYVCVHVLRSVVPKKKYSHKYNYEYNDENCIQNDQWSWNNIST